MFQFSVAKPRKTNELFVFSIVFKIDEMVHDREFDSCEAQNDGLGGCFQITSTDIGGIIIIEWCIHKCLTITATFSRRAESLR